MVEGLKRGTKGGRKVKELRRTCARLPPLGVPPEDTMLRQMRREAAYRVVLTNNHAYVYTLVEVGSHPNLRYWHQYRSDDRRRGRSRSRTAQRTLTSALDDARLG